MLNFPQRRYNRRAYKLRAKRRDAGIIMPGETLGNGYKVKPGDTMFNISRMKPTTVNRKLSRDENIVRVMQYFGMSRKGAEHMLPHLYNGAQFKEPSK